MLILLVSYTHDPTKFALELNWSYCQLFQPSTLPPNQEYEIAQLGLSKFTPSNPFQISEKKEFELASPNQPKMALPGSLNPLEQLNIAIHRTLFNNRLCRTFAGVEGGGGKDEEQEEEEHDEEDKDDNDS